MENFNCIVDFNKDLLYYSTDIFSTKPLWIAQMIMI